MSDSPQRVGPWRRAAPKAQDRVPRRGTIRRSGMKAKTMGGYPPHVSFRAKARNLFRLR